MKKFIAKIFLFIIPVIIFGIFVIYRAGGASDNFYVRFTTPKHKYMILGTSRAAQGLRPEVFKNILNVNVGNYAFTVVQSPFGKVYFESIQRKHSKEKGGLFIVAVDPWSISSWCRSPNNLKQFRENKLCVGNTKVVDLNPNIFYIYHNFSGKFKDLILPSNDKTFLHKDGWLEVSGIAMDSLSLAKRIADKVKIYKNEHLPKTKFSSVRVNYLVKTIAYLKGYGQVYLVRLPIHKSIMEIEQTLMPDFDVKIQEAIGLSDGYLDMTSQNDLFEYTDGNHLYKTSGEKVSTIIANWINAKQKTRK
jgi:hypothetical protein